MNIEVTREMFEFFLSCLVIAGGGYLIATGKGEATFVTSMIAIVITFWFQGRALTKMTNSMFQNQNSPAPQLQNPAPVTQANPSSQVLAPQTTNPTNPAVTVGEAPKTGNNI